MINVLLVDDHELVRTGIRRILDDVRGFKVVGEAKDGEAAVQFCRQHTPNIVLMDMNMPGMGGLEATKKICRYCPDVKIIVLTVNCEDPFPSKVMQIGAHGFLTKGAGSDEMVRAIRSVHAGQRYIAPEIAQQIALAQVTGRTDENPFQSLSERELQIMLMITKGEKAQDIAERLNLSSKTVNSYRYRMFEKLNVGGDVELTHLAIRHKMIDIDISY
ncbi:MULTISPECIES: UvrY/SirA/GacA family response regulator transcription factor [unclassified Pseudoalteromonas]|uniref:UvrY/SirA/GacA family response regulator transcription factor n=1 Tax=unclassified Pseudoalteromonas TaxID=194690 RepID=UPI0007323233|nr:MULTISPECIES: UvrY/SirA/GacA family response regulator transcription factor [unclassified Pseudoalteromonas]KTF09592.1 two-component system response regulator [Pseudoalteromonas sp. 10-33]MBW4968122.1 UvrY/SirA/GacA family response regulator transcription factor [Pseudoalteromonas sp. CR1]TMN77000.1 two-component system response regulator UvrY [Pseudoalteromonas sp. S410]TMN87715.1 two-component system response regulator UvrY [Pseudoalteromonas sp. S408]TMN95536.1 two-component system respo